MDRVLVAQHEPIEPRKGLMVRKPAGGISHDMLANQSLLLLSTIGPNIS